MYIVINNADKYYPYLTQDGFIFTWVFENVRKFHSLDSARIHCSKNESSARKLEVRDYDEYKRYRRNIRLEKLGI